jgi:uncharacterized protein
MRMDTARMSQKAITVIVDTGPLYALFDSRDAWHERCYAWFERHPKATAITTWVVLAEVCHLISRRIHNQAALDFLAWIKSGAVQIDTPNAYQSLDHMLASCTRYADLPLDLADSSVAEAAARLGVRHILSVDPDLTIYRDTTGKPLVNILLT